MPAGVELALAGDGWQAPAQTNVFGQYAFRNFGDEIAFLNAFIPPEREDLFLLTSDLPVWIRSDSELVVNIALYPKGITPDPALHVKIDASAAEVAQDENVSYTITVLNSSNQDVSQVVIADLMPEGLSLVEALTSQGTAIQFSGYATDEDEGSSFFYLLSWISDEDGSIGLGNSVSTSSLSIGKHTISAYATDSLNETGRASITITVE